MCPRKTPYKILLPIIVTRKKTKKTDGRSAASLGPSTRAKTAVDGRAVSFGYTASACINSSFKTC